MTAGRMQHHRQLLWSHRWVIASAFGGKVSKANIDSFILYGAASSGVPEQIDPRVWDHVAEIQRTGKVVFD